MAFLVDGGGLATQAPPKSAKEVLMALWDVIVRMTRAIASKKYTPVTPEALKTVLLAVAVLGIKVGPPQAKLAILVIVLSMVAVEIGCFLKWEQEQI